MIALNQYENPVNLISKTYAKIQFQNLSLCGFKHEF